MANTENLIPIPGRLKNVAVGGHVAGADMVYDDTIGKTQEEINSDVSSNKADKTSTVSNVTYDSSSRKIQKTINGTTTDVVTLPEAQVNSDWNASSGVAQILNKPSSLPASDVSAWAKAPNKPSYTKGEVGLGNVDNTADADKHVAFAEDAGTVNSHTVNADVPSGAVFTDTTYTFDGTYNASTNKAATVSTVTNAINTLDATKSQNAGTDGLALSITETDGKITSISGSIAANTYDAYGAASTAKTEVIGGASSSGNTLKKLEDRVSPLETAVGSGGSIDTRISNAVAAEATAREAADTALDGRIDTLEDIVEDCAYIGEDDGTAVIANFDPQTDTVWKKAQTLSNADKAQVKTNLGLPQEIYSKTEVNELVSTPHQNYVTVATYSGLPASGSTDTIYRVSNYDGTQVAAGVYSEYAWSGSAYVFLAAKSSVGEVFDISEYHAGTKYADLAAALGTNGVNIPESLRKGGMSVKFVLNSDNKYVQYFCNSQTFTTDVSAWEKINLEEELGLLSQKVGYKKELSANIATETNQVIGIVNIKQGDVLRIKCSGSFHANWVILANDQDLTYRLVDDNQYQSGKEYTLTAQQDVESLYLWMRDGFVAGTFEVELLSGLTDKVLTGFENVDEELQDLRNNIGFSDSLTKNVAEEATQLIGSVSIKKGDTFKIKCGGTFHANWIILANNNNLDYRLVDDNNYQSGKEYSVTAQQDVESIYLWMRDGFSAGTFSIDIIGGVAGDVKELELEKYEKPASGIPESDISEEFEDHLTVMEDRIIYLDDVVGYDYKKEVTPEDYADLIMDSGSSKVVAIPHSSGWNGVVVKLKRGVTYTIVNGIIGYISSKIPVDGMPLSEFKTVSTPQTPFTITEDSDRYLLININTELSPITIVEQVHGLVEITEHGKTGICLGDSNMQATAMGSYLIVDPATIIGQIMGATVHNGGIGGTTFANMGVDRPLNFTELCDALKTRDFTTFDADLEDFITAHPACEFLRARWAGIKSTPMSDIDFMVIAYGTNDWTAGRTLDNENNKLDTTTILGALRYGVKTLLEANPAIKLYVFTPAYRYGLNDDDNNDSDNYQISGKYLYDICNAIYDCCKELHIACDNYYYNCGLNKYSADAILDGGTHRTPYGYRLMAQQYTKFIMSC